MAKLIIKMLLPLVVLLAVPYIMLGGDMPGFLAPFLPSNGAATKKMSGLKNAVTDKEVRVYQWQDEKGVKHFSDVAPDDRQADSRLLQPVSNRMPAVKSPVTKTSSGSAQVKTDKLNPYSLGGAKKLLDDSRGLQDMINKQYEQQRRSIER